ncbi:MAG: dihydropteroate synthase [Planctomycetes bacterium]|nr:dihydropteroate synthase [Planctomycetota bacterium]
MNTRKLPDVVEWPKGKLDFFDGCIVMGILNVTPDSFSDGGQFLDIDKAVAHGVEMARQGAAIIDIGPESTRPGSEAVSKDEQIKRAVPVIKELSKTIQIPISIDTQDPDVAQAAIEAGASIINDITALADDRMTQIVVDCEVPVILMHMQGTPQTMQAKPLYDDVVSEVAEYLMGRAKSAEEAGIKAEHIFLDPGFGFGKTTAHNLQLLNRLDLFCDLGYRVLVGTSRKRFIGELTGGDKAADRIFGTAASVAWAIAKGASIVRVHDVIQIADVVKVTNAICRVNESVG